MIEGRHLAVTTIAAHVATLLFMFCYFWVLVITAVDSAFFYAAFPYRLFVTAALLVLLVLLPGKIWRFKLGLLLIVTVWFSMLPRVSWHEESNFFINAGTIRKGMKADEARRRMQPFLAETDPGGSEMSFQPAPGSADRCVVILQNGKVREVRLYRNARDNKG